MHIALLRGVNVGRGKPVAMADLAAMMAALGFGGARTLLRSGNIVFEAGAASPSELEPLLEQQIEVRLGVRTMVFVRSAEEWRQALAGNPFPSEAEQDPARLHLFALKAAPDEAAIRGLQAAIPGRERIGGCGRHLYVVYPDGAAAASLTPGLWARWLDPGTARNWNTARKLEAMAAG
jgi:uncharacterized protein (DUF1697 family)